MDVSLSVRLVSLFYKALIHEGELVWEKQPSDNIYLLSGLIHCIVIGTLSQIKHNHAPDFWGQEICPCHRKHLVSLAKFWQSTVTRIKRMNNNPKSPI